MTIRSTVFAGWLLAIIAVAGCATSLQPLATKEARVDLKDVAGEWVVEESSLAACRKGTKVRIARRDVGLFDVETTQDGSSVVWDCEVISLNETTFLDVFPQRTEKDDEPESILRIGTHAIFVIESEANRLVLKGFDLAKLEKLAHAEHLMAASPRNERKLFVADTKRLQEFFAKHGATIAQNDPVIILKNTGRR